MGQIDTFDPKALGDNQATKKKPGALYPSIDTSVPGVRVSEHLPRTARLMEHVTAVRSVNHKVIDEHAFATNLVHTGRLVSGNAVYPSIGSIVAHRRGAADPSVPAYLLIGYPNVSRGPGFLGIKDGYVYLVDTETGPAGFTRPEHLAAGQEARRRGLLDALGRGDASNAAVSEYAEAQREAFRLAGPDFMRHFDLAKEPAEIRRSYGGEFGQRCLLARRLVQGGVRFVEVSHNLNFINGAGWDVHNDGIRNQHGLIRELDHAFAGLIEDLARHRLLEKTLVVIATEFGRPPEFDARGGRGHQVHEVAGDPAAHEFVGDADLEGAVGERATTGAAEPRAVRRRGQRLAQFVGDGLPEDGGGAVDGRGHRRRERSRRCAAVGGQPALGFSLFAGKTNGSQRSPQTRPQLGISP